MLEPGTDIGAYRIEGLLGRGGMGIVYEATQHSLGRKVALKLLPAELSLDESFRNRFRREGRIQAGLDHAHIVPIYEAGDLGDHGLFIAMRLVRGSTLKELIKRGELDAARAMRVLRPVADALDTAHEADLVHRDIKPQNILVGRRDHAYLADFGLTRAPGDTAFTKTGHFVGTLDYIAPEQIRGEAPGPASDLYSFAAVAFECLTGAVPFPKPTEAAVMFAHMSDPPPRASALRPSLPAAVDDVLAAGMAKLPSERPDTVIEFVAALEDALGPARAAGPAAPPPPPADLHPVAPPPAPSRVAAAEASTMIPGDGRTTAPIEVAAATEVRTAASAAAPVVEPDEAVHEATGAGEVTEIHERSGAVTRPDRRRDWTPGPPQEIEPLADDVVAEVVADAPATAETAVDDVVAEVVADAPATAETAVDDVVAEVVADAPTTAETAADDVVAEKIAADEAATDETLADDVVAEVVADEAATEETLADAVVPGAEGAGEVVTSRAAAPVAARRPRRALPAVIGAAVLLAVAAVAGILAGGAGEKGASAPAAAPEAATLKAGPLALRGPAGWTEREAPQLPGLELSDAAAVGSGDGIMVAGMTAATGPALLPASFIQRLPEPPRTDDAVAVGAAQAYRYSDLQPDGPASDMTVLVAPTTAGVATVACLGTAADRRRCEAAAGSLALSDGVRAYRLGPSERYAREIGAPLDRLAAQRKSGLRRLAGAGTPKGQADAAAAIASAYGQAGAALARVEPNPPEEPAHAALRRAVVRAGKDYGALAAAARKERRGAYERAGKSARAADRAFNNALAELKPLGYRVR